MGIDKITIDNIYTENNKIFIKGQNFNEFSKVYVNNEYIETTFIDNNTLSIEDTDFPQSSSIVITQRTSGGGKLGSTNEYIY